MFTDVRLEREALLLSCGCTFLLGKKEKTKKPVGTKEGKPKMTSDTAGTTEITQGTEGWKRGWWGCSCVCISSFAAVSGDVQRGISGCLPEHWAHSSPLCSVERMELKNPFFCCFLPAHSEENDSRDLQSSPESGMGAEEGGLPEPRSPVGGDGGVTEPTKAGEAQPKAASNAVPFLGNPAATTLSFRAFASCPRSEG